MAYPVDPWAVSDNEEDAAAVGGTLDIMGESEDPYCSPPTLQSRVDHPTKETGLFPESTCEGFFLKHCCLFHLP